MEIRIYDQELNFIGIIENFTSLQWSRKYFESGCFELQMSYSKHNQSLIRAGYLIWKKDSLEAGVIEYITREEYSLTVKGRFLSSYMDRRLIKSTFNASNRKVEEVMFELLQNATAIPQVEYSKLKGFDEKITFQATYKNLLTYETKLSKYSNIAYRFRPDFVNKKILFETYKGFDRSINQSERPRVIFSESYENIKDTVYTLNEQLYKTVCYVGGQGEGDERTVVIVGDDTLTGLQRREVFLSATDINSNNITASEYKEVLKQRGETELNSDCIVESFESSCLPYGNFKYKRDFDLGDVVTITKESWGLQADLRITEINEIYESEIMSINLTFGTPLPEKWSDS